MNKTNKSKSLTVKILKIAALGIGFTAVSVLAPQLPYLLLKDYIKKKFGAEVSREQVANIARYLKRKKFIAYKNQGNGKYLILTKLGRRKLSNSILSEIKIEKVKWDGFWRLIIFDIPEENKAEREFFRQKLKKLGFFHFQRSVFIYPFPCDKEVIQVANHLNIEKDVHHFVIHSFRSDRMLMKKFKIKRPL